VVSAFQEAGGTFAIAGVRPGRGDGGRLLEVVDDAGRSWSAGQFAFCCGPWLPRVFPQLLRDVIRVTKQDVLFVGAPAGDARFRADHIPTWCDYDAAFYGMGATSANGFKIAPDRLGPVFDPSRGDRVVDPESVRLARTYLRRRFPDLAAAPVTATRVCQYESTVDGHFVIAPHPGYENVWLAGGGSGHGFKHGPRIGEYLVARMDGTPEGAQEGDEEERFRIGPRSAGLTARTAGDEMAGAWDLF
jgi:glycine/D-amino acid oxidase-like deaminating enzyme